MYEVSIQTTFAAAHRLDHYQGQCEALHGHNWKVVVTVQAETLNACGFVMDFKDLKALCRQIVDRLDHAYLNELEPFTRVNPSSEAIARFIYDELKRRCAPGRVVQVTKVSVWESDAAWATYSE
jgi:6-pyruvoyltetrahydropterin/6-carboxytetrahydropterin synthase